MYDSHMKLQSSCDMIQFNYITAQWVWSNSPSRRRWIIESMFNLSGSAIFCIFWRSQAVNTSVISVWHLRFQEQKKHKKQAVRYTLSLNTVTLANESLATVEQG